LEQKVSPAMLSFMSESRRLKNERIKFELGVRLQYPDVDSALRSESLRDAGNGISSSAEQ
jgi:hypothetical protein